MIKYIGSKRVLVPTLVGVFDALPDVGVVGDLFSGTARVGHALKRAGYAVRSNDAMGYAHALATCYVQADRERVLRDAERLIDEFSALPGRAGYFTHTFCERSRYVRPFNGERIDAIREAIACKGLGPELEAVCLVSLMEAADRVDSTTGVQMAYLKSWSRRSGNPLELRMPEVLGGVGSACGATCADALDAAHDDACDAVYIDPPYNQHAYLGNYHVWESLVRWDKPEVYGVACKRVDCRERKSDFNSKRRALAAFESLVARVAAPRLVVSFSDEGFLSRGDIERALGMRGDVYAIERPHPRYIGSRIGIYSPSGERVGTPGHAMNTEFVYVVVPEGSVWGHAGVGARRVGRPAALAAA